MSALFTTCELWTYVIVLWFYTYAVNCGYCTRTRTRQWSTRTRTCTRSYCTRNIPAANYKLSVCKLLMPVDQADPEPLSASSWSISTLILVLWYVFNCRVMFSIRYWGWWKATTSLIRYCYLLDSRETNCRRNYWTIMKVCDCTCLLLTVTDFVFTSPRIRQTVYVRTSPTISSHLTSLLGFVCVPQTDTSSSYLAVDSSHTAVGRFRSLVLAGPTVWNSLPDELRDPACGSDSFKQFLKTILSLLMWPAH